MTNLERVARTIAGLYNNAASLGLGMLQRTSEKMTIDEAVRLAREALSRPRGLSLDYLRGRVIKVDVLADGSVVRADLYDRDNGPGACERAVEDGLTDPTYDFSGIT